MLVICAATALTANTSRAVYLAENAAIVDAIAARLGGWDGVVVMVTNPVDPLTARLARGSGRRARPRLHVQRQPPAADAIAARRAATDVEAWVLGEHGDRAVPIFSRVRVAASR